MTYARKETTEEKAFYTPVAKLSQSTPEGIAKIVEQLAKITGLDRKARTFAVDPQTIANAADALEEVAIGLKPKLDSTKDDKNQLDRFIDAHIAKTKGEIPNEPLLYFCLGAWWGEWLCEHREAIWQLEAPLNPLQAFPDGLSLQLTYCVLPFSHVVKKVGDPKADSLAFKSGLIDSPRSELPPFPLIASTADAEHAVTTQFSETAQRAMTVMLEEGKGDEAFNLFMEALEQDVEEPRLLAFAIQHALRGGAYTDAEEWTEQLLDLVPGQRRTRNNLAYLYAETERIPEAIELLEALIKEDPQYARARLSLASLLLDADRREAAVKHLDWLITNDRETAEEARALRAAL